MLPVNLSKPVHVEKNGYANIYKNIFPNQIGDTVERVKNGIKDIPGQIGNAAKSIKDGVNNAIEGAVNRINNNEMRNQDIKDGRNTINDIASEILRKFDGYNCFVPADKDENGNQLEGSSNRVYVKGYTECVNDTNICFLHKPIRQVTVLKHFPESKKAILTVRNKLASYHNAIASQGDRASQNIAKIAYTGIFYTTSFLPIIFGTPGEILQKGISLTLATIARAVTLIVTQAMHILPYAIAAALVGAVGLGIVLAFKASPVIAALALVGAVALAYFARQHHRVNKLEEKNAVLQSEKNNQIIEKEIVTNKKKFNNVLGELFKKNQARIATRELLKTLGELKEKAKQPILNDTSTKAVANNQGLFSRIGSGLLSILVGHRHGFVPDTI